MKNGTINNEGLVFISPDTHALISQYVISSNDLYITIAGTIGAVGVVPQQFDGMNLTENAAKLIFRCVDKIWLQKALSSNYVQEQFSEKTNQLAQPKLALHRIESSIVFLPPAAEQHRIVAKVDELMAFCDQLEQTQSDNIAAHAQLVKALLATLTNSSDHKELHSNWQRITDDAALALKGKMVVLEGIFQGRIPSVDACVERNKKSKSGLCITIGPGHSDGIEKVNYLSELTK